MRDNCPAVPSYPAADGEPAVKTVPDAWAAVVGAHEAVRVPLRALAFDAGDRGYWRGRLQDALHLASEARRDYLAAMAAAGRHWTGPVPMEFKWPGCAGPDAPEWA